MLKKCFVGLLVVAAAGGIWNWTRVVAASERVRDAWIESQHDQTLEDWDVHYRKGLRELQQQQRKLEQKARRQRLAAETARIRIERIEARLAESRRVATAFEQQCKQAAQAGFVFAGQRYDEPLARLQASRFAAELQALTAQKQALTAQVASHGGTAEKLEQAAAAIELRARKLQQRAGQLVVRRQLVETRRVVVALEVQRERIEREGCRPLDRLESLCRTAEDALDREEARQRIRERQAPPRTLSLEEAARGQVH